MLLIATGGGKNQRIRSFNFWQRVSSMNNKREFVVENNRLIFL
jgi:hypothetical protein